MDRMDTTFSPVIIFRLPTSIIGHLTSIALATSNRSTIIHEPVVASTLTALFNIYILIRGSFLLISGSELRDPFHMPRQSNTGFDVAKSPPWREDGPNPEPDPTVDSPSAPPIMILSRSGDSLAAPYFQVPDPAANIQPQTPTSSSCQDTSTTPRYDLRKRDKVTRKRGPDNPGPEPHPAPPVIILSYNKRRASASPPRSTSPPSTAHTSSDNSTSATAGATNTSTPTAHKRTMGSRGSKLAPSHGKLQPSLERQDKAEMKEPSNYYSHRSKSMRRKAGKAEGGVDAGGAVGGTAGGAGGAGIA
ncbi:uncharacterized protein K460DRAFT_355901 [Cucurbitaria berberidis CBS 394.84]|uniref:Uncharacterized protein n=1 Tax=Cucurbitaria berberidis CBS 394.84 TaxID=1168544 RepID=A0A9P4GJ66_9PLEO|nr:uncharacterized protein K460DRAFT_355901 [Cucurbitaria berberidis CBS 394.84]KAF1846189.1 hypothetical protein K460DRAFT_355901 [Cucurbitaria berberidis CBS 394.84]